MQAPDSDDEESEDEGVGDWATTTTPTLAAFPGAARYAGILSALPTGSPYGEGDTNGSSALCADEALHHILRALLALSYEAAPLAAMVEEGVTARLARLAAAGPPAIAVLLAFGAGGGAYSSTAAPPEQPSEAVRSPLITTCGLLTNIITSAGHLAWPERGAERKAPPGRGGGAGGGEKKGRAPPRSPNHPVLAHPAMGECLVSLAEVAGLAGAARRSGGGARWRLLAAHATLVVMTVARAAGPGNGLAPARGLADRKARWGGGRDDGAGGGGAGGGGAPLPSVWGGMARAVNEALGSLSAAHGRGLIGGGLGREEEACYEEGAIWQWCLECAREMEAAAGGAGDNPYVAAGVVPRGVLESLIEASSDGRI